MTRRILSDDLGFLISRTSARLVRATNHALAPLGLKVRAYSVLAAVCDEPDGITQRRIATDVGLDPSQVVALIDDLEGRGLVIRETDPTDRRNKLILATDGGRTLCSKAWEISTSVAAAELDGFTATQLGDLRKGMYRLSFPNQHD